MSIRSNAYDLCKSVTSSPIRETVRTIIRDLNSATKEQIRTGNHRSSFGYAARQFHAQLFGYYLVDRNKERLAQSYPPLRGTLGLSEEERGILLQAHRQIETIDKNCVKKLCGFIPECSLAINPYHRFNQQIPEGTEDVRLYDERLAQTLVESFQDHPAVLSVLESRNRYEVAVAESEMPSVIDIEKAVLNLDQGLKVAGPLQAPRRLWELFITRQPGSADQALLNYICSLACIRASLDTLNELLYQAILTNKLPILDDDSIIEIGGAVQTSASTGFTIKYQPTEKSGIGSLGLHLVRTKIFERQLDLCNSEAVEVQVSGEFGDSITASLRVIDEHLNPYSGLLSHSEE